MGSQLGASIQYFSFSAANGFVSRPHAIFPQSDIVALRTKWLEPVLKRDASCSVVRNHAVRARIACEIRRRSHFQPQCGSIHIYGPDEPHQRHGCFGVVPGWIAPCQLLVDGAIMLHVVGCPSRFHPARCSRRSTETSLVHSRCEACVLGSRQQQDRSRRRQGRAARRKSLHPHLEYRT